MIYIYDHELQDADFMRYIPLLSNQRREKMEQYRFAKEQNTCLMAFLLLRYGLYEEYGITRMPGIHQEDRRYKPVLTNVGLHFNFSHCNRAVACVLDIQPVGIDVQEDSEELWRARAQFLSKRELNGANSVSKVTRIWTLKEAYGKFRGFGLDYSLKQRDFSMINAQKKWQAYQEKRVLSQHTEVYALSVFAENPLKVLWLEKDALIKGLNLILESGEIT